MRLLAALLSAIRKKRIQFIAPNSDLSPRDIAILQLELNRLTNDPKWKHKIIVLPPATRK